MSNLKYFLKIFKLSEKKLLLLAIIFIILLIMQIINLKYNKENTNTAVMEKNIAKVIKIIDGDTVIIKFKSGEEEKVRLIAVNTLETDSLLEREKCLAKLAEKYTQDNLLNEMIEIEADKTQPKRDKYGRLLLYIKKVASGTSFNEDLMYTGLSNTYKASPPAEKWSLYEQIRQQMEKEGRGIWDKKLCTGFAL